MEALEEIKEAYAKEVGAKNWELFINDQPNYMVEPIMDKIATRYAQQTCEDLRERIAESATIWVETDINGTEFSEIVENLGCQTDPYIQKTTVFKDSILNTKIILP